jgi:hypothetical protein
MGEYRIRNTKQIIEHIIPLFDKYPLLTSKYYKYDLFKQAALIKNNSLLTTKEKHIQLSKLKTKVLPSSGENYISPA